MPIAGILDVLENYAFVRTSGYLPGPNDVYVTLGYNGASYEFCVEIYLTGADSEVYTTVSALNVGDVVNVEGFLYWYEGMNPHITAIALAE